MMTLLWLRLWNSVVLSDYGLTWCCMLTLRRCACVGLRLKPTFVSLLGWHESLTMAGALKLCVIEVC